MSENAYFLEKSCKIAAAWGLRPHTPALLLLPTDIVLSNAFLSLKCTLLLQIITEETDSKCFDFAFTTLLRLFFTSNFAIFVAVGAKLFFASRRRVP